MGDLAIGLPTFCGHFVRGFLTAAIIEAVSCVGCNQPLLILLYVLIAPDNEYWQGSIAAMLNGIGPRGRAPLITPSGG
jgi:hypothetical protein